MQKNVFAIKIKLQNTCTYILYVLSKKDSILTLHMHIKLNLQYKKIILKNQGSWPNSNKYSLNYTYYSTC